MIVITDGITGHIADVAVLSRQSEVAVVAEALAPLVLQQPKVALILSTIADHQHRMVSAASAFAIEDAMFVVGDTVRDVDGHRVGTVVVDRLLQGHLVVVGRGRVPAADVGYRVRFLVLSAGGIAGNVRVLGHGSEAVRADVVEGGHKGAAAVLAAVVAVGLVTSAVVQLK
ncbi:hypothetical protein TYRP_003626 [Tyrophagus putrescentiae]|nr:hypothetical protein TYRP_003626 [Tyrophagus putrescentiae]